MLLPHLRKLLPKIETEPREEKLINGSSDDMLERHLQSELFDAIMDKDVQKFRSALEACVLNLFEDQEDEEG